MTVLRHESVSLLFAFGDPATVAAVRTAHETAIGQALAYLEKVAAHGLRGHGDGQRARQVPTDGLIAVAFEHRTSRAMDPQLHTHLVVPNLVHGTDGHWSALDTRALHRHARTAGYLSPPAAHPTGAATPAPSPAHDPAPARSADAPPPQPSP